MLARCSLLLVIAIEEGSSSKRHLDRGVQVTVCRQMCGIDQGRELITRLTVDGAVRRRGDLDDDAGRRDGGVLLFRDLDVPVAVGFVELDAPHVRSDRVDILFSPDAMRTLVL